MWRQIEFLLLPIGMKSQDKRVAFDLVIVHRQSVSALYQARQISSAGQSIKPNYYTGKRCYKPHAKQHVRVLVFYLNISTPFQQQTLKDIFWKNLPHLSPFRVQLSETTYLEI
jgi:hypothetical protein